MLRMKTSITGRQKVVKYYHLLFLIIVILIGHEKYMDKKSVNPEFEIHGDKNVLNDMVINIETHANSAKYPRFTLWKIETVLYKGIVFHLNEDEDDVVSYIIYYAYGEQVGMLRMDAEIPREAREGHDIHTLYVCRKDDRVYLKYYSRKSDIANDNPLIISDVTLPYKQYFNKNSTFIDDSYEQHLIEKFQLYEPNTQFYKLYPYNKMNFDYYKKLTLEEKKKIVMPEEYLREMNLPVNEMNELIAKHRC